MCRSGDPLAHVYHPWRLQVVCACATVSGTVETARHGDEGDYDIDLALDPAYAGMADAANTADQHGGRADPVQDQWRHDRLPGHRRGHLDSSRPVSDLLDIVHPDLVTVHDMGRDHDHSR